MTVFPPKFGGWVELLEANGFYRLHRQSWGPGFTGRQRQGTQDHRHGVAKAEGQAAAGDVQ